MAMGRGASVNFILAMLCFALSFFVVSLQGYVCFLFCFVFHFFLSIYLFYTSEAAAIVFKTFRSITRLIRKIHGQQGIKTALKFIQDELRC